MGLKNSVFNLILIRRFTAFVIVMFAFNAKSNPISQIITPEVMNRAKSLDCGISISWLDQTWNKAILDTFEVNKNDFRVLKTLGFKTIRLPVAFAFFESEGIPDAKVLALVDEVVKQCKLYNFKLIIDYHYGKLNDTNYLTETPKIIAFWLKLTKRYSHESPDNLFFELYNEPPHMNPQVWKDAAYNIVTAIRKIDKERTLLVGASNYNSLYELSRFVRLADNNIIYTFHFYEPFLFTHQGAEWVGDQVATVGVPFPYNGENFPKLNPKAKNTSGEKNYNEYPIDGNEQSVKDKLQIVKKWSEKYGVPIICGEYGVYNKHADLDSRCRYIKAVRTNLKTMHIPGILWDYNTNFSIFNGPPSVANLPDCMKDAIGYHP